MSEQLPASASALRPLPDTPNLDRTPLHFAVMQNRQEMISTAGPAQFNCDAPGSRVAVRMSACIVRDFGGRARATLNGAGFGVAFRTVFCAAGGGVSLGAAFVGAVQGAGVGWLGGFVNQMWSGPPAPDCSEQTMTAQMCEECRSRGTCGFMKPWLIESLGWKKDFAWIALTFIAIALAVVFGFRPVYLRIAGCPTQGRLPTCQSALSTNHREPQASDDETRELLAM
jgi:hypothetical protein